MTITAAIDGSALGNPGPAGWAWVVSGDCWDADGWPEATNNIGELTALLQLLRASREAGLTAEELHVQADSQYVINAITKWRFGWKKRGWTKADKKPIKNLEIIQDIDREMEGRTVTFEWIRGHTGHPLNEKADDLARGAAEAYQSGTTPTRGPGFSSSSDEDGATALGPSEASAADYRGANATDEDGATAPGPSADVTSGSAAPASAAAAKAESESVPGPAAGSAAAPASGGSLPVDSAAAMDAEERLLDARLSDAADPIAAMLGNGFQSVSAGGVTSPDPLALQLAADAKASAIRARALGPGTWLTCYRVRSAGVDTLQATTWLEQPDGGLKAVWHQETPIA